MTTNNGHPPINRATVESAPVPRPLPATRQPRKKRSFLGLYAFLFLLLMAGVVALVFFHRMKNRKALDSATTQMAMQTVLVVQPEKGDPQVHLTLPGTIQAEIQSSVYTQVSGYIKRWLVDIGTQVKEGQLLAEIDTPVTDQQLRQAQDSVAQAQANLNLAKVTAARYNGLFQTHAVSQQDVDNQNAGVEVQKQNLAAAQAAVSGIEQTEAFKQVKAPFDGVITSRRIDVGDYVSATGQSSATNGTTPSQTGTPNQALFQVAQIKMLRVYINVPEHYADEIVPGTPATLEFASAPNKKVTGQLVRTSSAIDPNSLTLLAEVDVPNPDEKLLPGGYAQVHFDINSAHPPLVIPGNTLIFRAQGTQVGIVDDSGVVHLKDIKITRDLGTKLEVIEGADGLSASDHLILNPSDSLTDGTKVQVKTDNKPPAP